MSSAKVRAYSDENTIAAALVYDVPAAHEIARWLRQQPELMVLVRPDGIRWMDMNTEEGWHARFGDYVVLKPTGFEVVREED